RLALVQAAYRASSERLCAEGAHLAATEPPAEALVDWLRGFVTVVAEKRGLAAALTDEGQAIELFAQCHTMINSTGADLLDRAKRAGAVRDDITLSDVLKMAKAFAHAAETSPEGPALAERPLGLSLDGLLTAVAMATERLRLCPLVFNNDLRHPAVLAQDLATIDLLSEGRLVVGIGAGWNEPEYRSVGLSFDPPSVRISRMLEAVAILKGLFSDQSVTFDGRFYTISRLDGQPKPVQRPHPPFLIGGTRERVLRIAARE